MIKSQLRTLLLEAVQKVCPGAATPTFEIERPKVKAHGELSTNLALLLGKSVGKKPLELAQAIADSLQRQGTFLERVEVAGGGFVNFTLKKSVWQESLREIDRLGDRFGRSSTGQGKKVNVEFVSANPTGPIHIGNARGGPLGDTIAELLDWVGYAVTREYYVNDVGGQIEKLGQSIQHDLFPEAPLEVGYLGSYIHELAERAKLKNVRITPEELGKFGMEEMMTENRMTCEAMEIHFRNNFVKESDILAKKTEKIVERLKKQGVAVEKDGALWLATQDEFLQDRECVLVRSDGRPTYFANDIAYHVDKYERGFDRIIDVWGSNHHGHVPRM